MTTLRTLSDIGLQVVGEAFLAAFADYGIAFGRADLERMLERRGYSPDLSFGAFDADRLVAFTLNCQGTWQGLPTVYDTSTGTVPSHRRLGLAQAVIEHSLPFLRNAGARQYLLEVLQSNSAAIGLYERLGFERRRELLVFHEALEAIPNRHRPLSPGYKLRPLTQADPAALEACWDCQPSWQNDLSSMRRSPHHFEAHAVYEAEAMVGYLLMDPTSGDLTQLAVDPRHRGQGIGWALFQQAIRSCSAPRLKCVNVDASCTSMLGFLKAVGLPLRAAQYEMLLPL